MRSPLLLLCLLTTVASAQQADAPPDSEFAPYPQPSSTPPPPLVAAPEEPRAPEPRANPPADAPRAPVLAEEPRPPPARATTRAPPAPTAVPEKRPGGRSSHSAGSGGATLVVTEALSGLVGGAMLGSTSTAAAKDGSNDAYTGAVLGGLVLGAASTLYQHYVPVERNESLLAAGAATTGFMAGLTLANAQGMDARQRALLSLASTQVGVGAVLLLTSGGDDVSSGDAALVGMTSLYGGVVTSLFQYLHAHQRQRDFNFHPVLLAPAAGMVLGSLLALPLELSPREVLALGGLPLAVGVTILWAGVPLTNGPTVAKAVLIGMGSALVLTTLATALSSGDPPSASTASSVQALPVPVVMPAGVRNDALAVGPGLQLIF